MPAATNGSAKSASPFTDNFTQFAKDILSEWNIPGAAIAVVDGNEIFSEAFGFSNLPDLEATPDTLWYFGSAIKTSTAAVLAHLIDTKAHPLLSKGWATPVSRILPEEFVLSDDWATKHITLEDLVCHRSGMNRHDLSMPAYGRNGKVLTLAEQVCNLKNLPFTHEPRSEHMYCNYGYLTLSCVIEKVTGKPFKEALAEVIWKPLQMNCTYYAAEDIPKGASERLSTGYRWDSQAKKNIPIGTGACIPAVAGAGAGITSVRDLAKLVQCFLHETEPFSKSCHADMKHPRVVAVPVPQYGTDISTYGLGVYRTVYKNTPVFSHSGTLDSHGSEIVWIPDLKFGVVLMANGSGTSNRAGRALVYRLIDDKLEIPVSDRIDINAMQRVRHDSVSSIDGEEIFYPNRPNPPLPPSVDTAQLAGTYYAVSHGTLELRVASHPVKNGENILLADRNDVCFVHTMEFRHVSGDYWLALVTAMNFTVPFAAKFLFGIDGKPTSVEVDYTIPPLGMDEGPVLFKRVE